MMPAIMKSTGRWRGPSAWTWVYRLHLAFGLCVGLPVALMGVTGSVLVFSQPLDQWLNPNLRSTPASSTVSLDSAVSIAVRAVGAGATAWRFDLPAHERGMHTIHFRRNGNKAGLEITVDPYTGRITSIREADRHVLGLMYQLHSTLLAGGSGRTAAGIFGLLLLLMLLSGLLLWCKRAAARDGSGSQGRTLHRFTGLLVTPVLLVVGIGGVYLAFPGPFFALISSDGTSVPSIQIPVTGDIGLEQATARARHEIPGGEIKRIYINGGHYRITLRLPGEPRRSNGMNTVRVHKSTGDVLQTVHYRSKSAGERALAWLFPLHNGEALGMPWRFAVGLAGLAPTVLLFTGGGRWWLQRRRRTRERRLGRG